MPERISVVLLMEVDAPHVPGFLMYRDLLQIVPCIKTQSSIKKSTVLS